MNNLQTTQNSRGAFVGPQILFRPKPDHIDHLFYSATGNIAYTIPAGAKWIVFSAGVDFYVDPKALLTAAPSATVITGAGLEKNPVGYEVVGDGAEVLNVIATAADTISISVYT